MNFAEAALLIQGTSVIYSRKVEYLYALVFQTLAHLSNQTYSSKAQGDANDPVQQAEAGAVENNGADGGTVDLSNPLPLFDHLPEAKNISLKRTGQTTQPPPSGSKGKRRPQHSKNNIQAAIALMGSLVPDERDHGETFKLLSCALHPSGVLLLDDASKSYLSSDQQKLKDHEDPTSEVVVRSSANDESFEADEDVAMDAEDGGDVDFGAPGADIEDNTDEDHPNESEDPQAQEAQSGPMEPEEDQAMPLEPPPAARPSDDPWAPLDPYDASGSSARPFRKGRSYPLRKKPQSHTPPDVDGLDDPKFKERFFFGANRPQWTSWVWNETKDGAMEAKFQRKFCKAPLLLRSCEPMWRMETKWRSLMRRHQARQQQSAQAILLQEAAEEEEEQQMHAMLQSSDLVVDEQEEDEDPEDDTGVQPDFSTGDWGASDPTHDAYLMGEDEDAAYRPAGLTTYEDICRQHIESFMKGAEKYVRETDLSKQVNDWQSKLKPLLQEQDERPPFDIQLLGREILGHLELEGKLQAEESAEASPAPAPALSKKRKNQTESPTAAGTPIPFGSIVGGRNSYEVCRLFLASLQLANNGNVELVHAKTAAEQAHVPFQMQLLSTSDVYHSLQQEA